MGSYCVEYFATVGRSAGSAFSPKLWEREEGSGKLSLHPRDVWGEAITDIAFVMGKETIPPNQGWELIQHSVEHREMNPPHLAVRRRKHSGRLDHITQIVLVPTAEKPPKGFEVVKHSISGIFSAHLNPLGFVAVRRAEDSAAAYVQGEAFIDDFCLALLYHGEEVPEFYKRAGKAPMSTAQQQLQQQSGILSIPSALSSMGMNRSAATPSQPGNATTSTPPDTSDVVALCYHLRPAMGLCDLEYTPVTQSRYPAMDTSADCSLPSAELPMFAFPNGTMSIEFGTTQQRPKEAFSSFVLTDLKGNNLHAACLTFYEPVDHDDVGALFESIYGSDKAIRILSGTAIYCPKVICAFSSRPYYRALSRFLQQLFTMSISGRLPCPLEHYIASVVAMVPLPVEGGRPFHIVLDAALISPKSRPLPSLVFDLPPRHFFPLVDLDFASPLRCLSVDNMLAVFALMLEEAKILFVCSTGNTLLSETMEVLRALLYPLSWPGTFVSRLPTQMSTYLEAPGGFMIGVSSVATKDKNGVLAFESSSSLNWQLRAYAASITSGTYVVDLSANCISQWDAAASSPLLLAPSRVAALVKGLPTGARRRLSKKLEALCDEFQFCPGEVSVGRFMDNVFGSAANAHLSGSIATHAPTIEGASNTTTTSATTSSPTKGQSQKRERRTVFPALEVRDNFLQLMIDVLGHSYTRFIIPPSDQLSADTYRTFKESFATEAFLAESDKELRPLLCRLLETQMFSFLLQQRNEGAHSSLSFFEAAADIVRDFGLSSGGRQGPTHLAASTYARSKGVEVELPAPLYQLVAADQRWSQSVPHFQDAVLAAHLRVVQAETRKSSFSLSSPLSTLSTGPNASRERERSVSSGSLQQSTLSGAITRRTGATGLTGLEAALCMLRHCNEQGLSLFGMGDFCLTTARKSEPHAFETELGGGVALSGNREELNLSTDFKLCDSSFGPLVLPGPCSERQPISDAAPSSSPQLMAWLDQDARSLQRDTVKPSLEDAQRFSYPLGWPTLSTAVFEEARLNAIHPQLIRIRLERLFAMAKERAGLGATYFSRATSERLAFTHNARICSTLRHATSTPGTFSPILQGQSYSHVLSTEAQAAVAAARDVVASSCLMMSLRVIAGQNPVADMLQVLGIICQCQPLGLLDHLDEAVLCGLLSACVAQGGDFSRAVAAAASDVFLSSESSPPPSADTAGQLLLALSTKRPRDSKCVPMLDPHMHLQETGWVFLFNFLRRRREQSGQAVEKLRGDSASPINPDGIATRDRVMSSGGFFETMAATLTSTPPPPPPRTLLVDSSRSPKTAPPFASNAPLAAAAAAASEAVSKRLALCRDAGMLSLVGPAELRWQPLPQVATSVRAKVLLPGTAPGSTAVPVEVGPLMEKLVHDLGAYLANLVAQTEALVKDPKKSTSSDQGGIVASPSLQVVSRPTVEETVPTSSLECLGFSDDEDDDDEDENQGVDGTTGQRRRGTQKKATPAAILIEEGANGGGNLTSDLDAEVMESNSSNGDTVLTPDNSCPVPRRPGSVHFGTAKEQDFIGGVESPSRADTKTPRPQSAQDPTKKLHESVLSVLAAETQARGRAVGIFSRTPCECGHAMLDEEVLAFWAGFGHCQINTHAVSKDLTAAHRVLCPDCHRDAAPLLHVRCYQTSRPPASGPLELCWSDEVALLSPFGLRCGVEDVVALAGDEVTDGRWLHRHRPDLFWNLNWYMARLRLPLGLVSNTDDGDVRSSANLNPGSWTGAVVVGWRESVVAAQVYRLLTSPAPASDMLSLRDVFPLCTRDDVDAARAVVSALDGSTVGAREALRLLSQLPNITSDAGEGEGGGGARAARSLYVSLLTLTFLFRPEMLSPRTTTDGVLLGLGKVVAFDRLFIDTVKCVLSAQDFVALGTTDRHLLDAVATRCEQSMRLAFGFLY